MRGGWNAGRSEALAKTRSDADVHGLQRIWQVSVVSRQGNLGSLGVRRRPQQVSRRNRLNISTIRCLYTMIVGAWSLRPASFASR